MSKVIQELEKQQLRRVPDFRAGDRVRVHFQVIEGSRKRTQVFEGVVIKRQGHGVRETFTVRKQSFGVGVERTFPLHSPKIEKIEVSSRGEVRRAKLYYLRDRIGKKSRVRERAYVGPEEAVEGGLLHEQELAETEVEAPVDDEQPLEEQVEAEAEATEVETPEAEKVDEAEGSSEEDAGTTDEDSEQSPDAQEEPTAEEADNKAEESEDS